MTVGNSKKNRPDQIKISNNKPRTQNTNADLSTSFVTRTEMTIDRFCVLPGSKW